MWTLFKGYCKKVWDDLEDWEDLGALILTILFRILIVAFCSIQVIYILNPEILGPFNSFKILASPFPEELQDRPCQTGGRRAHRAWAIITGIGSRVTPEFCRPTWGDSDEIHQYRKNMRYCYDMHHQRVRETAFFRDVYNYKKKKDG